MADYKRMVSYMYQYENGVKRKNVGYARVEAKNGQCKITLHMQLLGQLDSIFPTYLIQRDENNLELIYLGDTLLKSQVMDSKLTADEDNIMGSGYGLSDMGGLLIFLNDNVFFATEWDDKPIVEKEVLEAMKPKSKPKKSIVSEETKDNTLKLKPEETQNISKEEVRTAASIVVEEKQEPSIEDEATIPKYKLPRGWKTIERLQNPYAAKTKQNENIVEVADMLLEEQAEGGESIELSINEDENQAKGSDYSEQNSLGWLDDTEVNGTIQINDTQGNDATKKNEDTEKNFNEVGKADNEGEGNTDNNIHLDRNENIDGNDKLGENDSIEMMNMGIGNEADDLPDPPTARHFFENYPRIYPFEDNEITLCVKIEPKDIGLLPKDIWVLSNNSFLMHGFYCYHHLIFAKMKDRFGCRYVLGIPGIFHNREKFMARMFGFESFKSIRKRELRQGDFGYWYLPISL